MPRASFIGLFEQLHIVVENILFSTLTAGNLSQNSKLLQIGDQFVG